MPKLPQTTPHVLASSSISLCAVQCLSTNIAIWKRSSRWLWVRWTRNLHSQQDRQCTYNVALRRVLATIAVVEEQWVLLKLSVYLVASMQCPSAILLSVACPTLQYLSKLSYKRYDFRKIVIEHKMCFNFLYNVCRKHFSFYEELSDKWSKMQIGLQAKYPLSLFDFNKTWILSTDFRQKNSNIKFHENSYSGTDEHEGNSHFSQFCESA